MKNFINTIVKSIAVVALFAAPILNAQAAKTTKPVTIPWPPIVRPVSMQATDNATQFATQQTDTSLPWINIPPIAPKPGNTNSLKPGMDDVNSLKPGIVIL